MNPAPLAAFLGLLPRHAIGLGFCLVVLVVAVAALLLRNPFIIEGTFAYYFVIFTKIFILLL